MKVDRRGQEMLFKFHLKEFQSEQKSKFKGSLDQRIVPHWQKGKREGNALEFTEGTAGAVPEIQLTQNPGDQTDWNRLGKFSHQDTLKHSWKIFRYCWYKQSPEILCLKEKIRKLWLSLRSKYGTAESDQWQLRFHENTWTQSFFFFFQICFFVYILMFIILIFIRVFTSV